MESKITKEPTEVAANYPARLTSLASELMKPETSHEELAELSSLILEKVEPNLASATFSDHELEH